MNKNLHNSRRILANVVSIDAWHDEFNQDIDKVDLHVDVVFDEARVGGEVESPVEFRLRIKRAELVVVVPETEPISVDRHSVSRDGTAVEMKRSQTIKKGKAGNASAKLDVNMGARGLSGSVKGKVEADAHITSDEKIELNETVMSIRATQLKTDDRHYCWKMEPVSKEALSGRPWNAIEQPRMKLVDLRKGGSSNIEPCVQIEIRCLKEDLDIYDIKLKDEKQNSRFLRGTGRKLKEAAAVAYIRDCLVSEGLEVGNLDSNFGNLTIASVVANVD